MRPKPQGARRRKAKDCQRAKGYSRTIGNSNGGTGNDGDNKKEHQEMGQRHLRILCGFIKCGPAGGGFQGEA